MNILFLSAWDPHPPSNGSKLRIFNLLKGLARHHHVSLVTFSDRADLNAGPELRALCRDVQVIAHRRYRATSPRAFMGFLSSAPRVIVDTHVPAMTKCIQDTVRRGNYDLVIASEWVMAAYREAYRGIPAICDDVELGIFEAKKRLAPTVAHRLRHTLPLLKIRFYLGRLLSEFQACTVVSEQERALVRRLVPRCGTLEMIPNCVELANYRDVHVARQPKTLIFTGSFRFPVNHQAMVWFLERVYPRVQARIPDVRLVITGDHANLPLPTAANVTLTGFVDDVRPLIASASVSLAPIWFGGGTRLKLLEAMALGTPVVSTSKGAEGLDVRDHEHLLIADTDDTFAEQVLRLLMDPQFGKQLALNAYRLVQEKYDWATTMTRFIELAERVAHAPNPSLALI